MIRRKNPSGSGKGSETKSSGGGTLPVRPRVTSLYGGERKEPELQTINEIPRTYSSVKRSKLRIPSLVVYLAVALSLLYYWSLGPEFVHFSPITQEEVLTTERGGDFRIFWSTGYFAAHGTPERARDDESMKQLPTLAGKDLGERLSLYPPTWLVPMGIFGKYDFPDAWFAFVWGSIFLYFFSVGAAFREHWRVALPLALGFSGVWVGFSFGQISPAIASLFLLTFAALPRHQLTAGLLLGVATLKPHLGVLMPLFLLMRRHLATVFWAIFATGALVALSVFLYGTGIWEAYFADILRPLDRLVVFQSTRCDTMISAYAGYRMAGVSAPLAFAGHGILALCAVVGLINLLRTSYDPNLPFAAAIITTLIVLPHAYVYDLVLLVIPLLIVFFHLQERGWETEDFEIIVPLYGLPIVAQMLNQMFFMPIVPIVLLFILKRVDVLARECTD